MALAAVLMSATVVMNIFEELSYESDKAETNVIQIFGRGEFRVDHELVKKARHLPEDLRVEGARQLIRFAKTYTQSAGFKKKYTQWRNEQLGYSAKPKKKLGIPNPMKMLDKAIDKTLNKSDDDKKIPEDPQQLIKDRLKEFLSVSATVDFDATLNGQQFAKPEYESKGDHWKMCYRAGKAVITAAREEAEAWLKELE